MSTVETPAPRRMKPVINRRLQAIWEGGIEFALQGSGLLSVLITLAIAVTVFWGAGRFFLYKDVAPNATEHVAKEVAAAPKNAAVPPAAGNSMKQHLEPMSHEEIRERIWYFFTGNEWTAGFQNARYGILPLFVGTLVVAFIAGLFALPIGLTSAIYMSEYASPRVRAIAKPTLELLAGIPTVVYGFFAIITVTPTLSYLFEGNMQGYQGGGLVQVLLDFHILPLFPGHVGDPNNQIAGGIVVGIMIIPMVASVSEDALRAVPRALRDGAIALGANKFETSVKVVLPAALSGVTASFILAISRAIGETMAVSLACGDTARLTFDPREGFATMTSFIVRIAKGDVQVDSTDYNSLYAVACVLFLMTLGMNILAQLFLRKYRQVYQ